MTIVASRVDLEQADERPQRSSPGSSFPPVFGEDPELHRIDSRDLSGRGPELAFEPGENCEPEHQLEQAAGEIIEPIKFPELEDAGEHPV